MSGEGRVVCVTGASGYIASWLVKLLLQSGYTVKATVRDPNDAKKTEHLRALDGAKERLVLLKANLLEEGSFDPVIDGCEGVFHTASPVLSSSSNPQDELIEPAKNGTLNVLRSCAKAVSVKRVVLTSSIGSVISNGKPMAPDVVVDETWFSDAAFWESNERWYMLSKTLAEEAAWEFAKENGLDIVAINPGFVLGPLLQATINLTSEVFLKERHCIKRNDGAQTFLIPNTTYVDVRDVANAHLQAFEISSASGRYCIVEAVADFSEIAKIVLQHYPSLRLPGKFEDDKHIGLKYQVSKEKARTLGINFIPLEVSVKATIESFKEMGLLDV